MVQILKQICTDYVALALGILAGIAIWYIGILYLDVDLVAGNLGYHRVYAEIVLHLLLALLFTVFITATVYKWRRFHTIKPTRQASGGSIGGFLGLIVTGCSSCSITLASYLGLGAILVQMPFNGLEVKVLGVGLLARATYDTLIHVNTCTMRISQKKSLQK